MKTITLTTHNDLTYYYSPEISEFVNSEDNNSRPYKCDEIDLENAKRIMAEKGYIGKLEMKVYTYPDKF